MSLGYLNNYANTGFTLIPVGMNYFKRDSFRKARVFIDVGEPIDVSSDLIGGYAQGGQCKREAVNRLLTVINESLYHVTTMAPDWRTLHHVNTARHILTGKDIKLTTEQKLKFNRNLVVALETFHDDVDVLMMRERVSEYHDLLYCTHQRDYNISRGEIVTGWTIGQVIMTTIKLCGMGVLCLPGLSLGLPWLIVISLYSSHYQKTALRKSKVKISAMDVLATGKVVSATICFVLCVMIEPAIFLLISYLYGYHITFMDYIGLINILPWIFYITIMMMDQCSFLYASLRFGMWMIMNRRLDRFVMRMREQLRIDLNRIIEEKGPVLFGSIEEFERKRVMKDGEVSMKRVRTVLGMNEYILENMTIGRVMKPNETESY